MLIFSKGRSWGLNIIVEIDLGNFLRSDSRGLTNLYAIDISRPDSHSVCAEALSVVQRGSFRLMVCFGLNANSEIYFLNKTLLQVTLIGLVTDIVMI